VGGMTPTQRLTYLMLLGVVVGTVGRESWMIYHSRDDFGGSALVGLGPLIGGAIAGLVVELLLRRKKTS
jgi:hypothetical protein